jgi:hypothetical protein
MKNVHIELISKNIGILDVKCIINFIKLIALTYSRLIWF